MRTVAADGRKKTADNWLAMYGDEDVRSIRMLLIGDPL